MTIEENAPWMFFSRLDDSKFCNFFLICSIVIIFGIFLPFPFSQYFVTSSLFHSSCLSICIFTIFKWVPHKQTQQATPECDDSMTHATPSCPTCSPVTLLFLEQITVMFQLMLLVNHKLPFLTHSYAVYHPNDGILYFCILEHL